MPGDAALANLHAKSWGRSGRQSRARGQLIESRVATSRHQDPDLDLVIVITPPIQTRLAPCPEPHLDHHPGSHLRAKITTLRNQMTEAGRKCGGTRTASWRATSRVTRKRAPTTIEWVVLIHSCPHSLSLDHPTRRDGLADLSGRHVLGVRRIHAHIPAFDRLKSHPTQNTIFFVKRGRIGCAYYDPVNSLIHVLEDTQETAHFDVTKSRQYLLNIYMDFEFSKFLLLSYCRPGRALVRSFGSGLP